MRAKRLGIQEIAIFGSERTVQGNDGPTQQKSVSRGTYFRMQCASRLEVGEGVVCENCAPKHPAEDGRNVFNPSRSDDSERFIVQIDPRRPFREKIILADSLYAWWICRLSVRRSPSVYSATA